jgi:hypothetical protein
MLTIFLPKSVEDRTDRCQINGRDATFKIEDLCFDFRYDGEAEWNRRYIVSRIVVDEDRVQVTCSDEDVPPGHVEAAARIMARLPDSAGLDPVVFARAMRMGDVEERARWYGFAAYGDDEYD